MHVSGFTSGPNFPTLNAIQPSFNNAGDAFVAGLSPLGVLTYSTYLGGSSTDVGYSVATDAAGNAYVVGYTDSTDFPTQSPFQPANNGGTDVFIAKISPSGTLAYVTYLGGELADYGFGVAVDPSGTTYLAGLAGSAAGWSQNSSRQEDGSRLLLGLRRR